MNKPYQLCTFCIMDSTDPDIVFDEQGQCNYCRGALLTIKRELSPEIRELTLNNLIQKIKKEGKKSKYDCIIGLSGGIDSSYLAYILVRKYGIRPLAVHVDNGWNSEPAVSNIYNIVEKLKIDLYTHVIDWEEFKQLQRSFLYASVVDLEMLSDHAIVVIINKLSYKKRIKYFCIGSNYQTESIMPPSWFYSEKFDSKNIRDIYKIHGNNYKISTFPFLTFCRYFFFGKRFGQYLMPLSFMDYNKESAKEELRAELGWQDYGAKHHESFITKFYQTYILPQKFKIDKRRAHLSSLICANQITRDDALIEIAKPLIDNNEIESLIYYFCKKMDLSKEQFQYIMQLPRKEHSEFKSYKTKKDIIWRAINKYRDLKSPTR